MTSVAMIYANSINNSKHTFNVCNYTCCGSRHYHILSVRKLSLLKLSSMVIENATTDGPSRMGKTLKNQSGFIYLSVIFGVFCHTIIIPMFCFTHNAKQSACTNNLLKCLKHKTIHLKEYIAFFHFPLINLFLK